MTKKERRGGPRPLVREDDGRRNNGGHRTGPNAGRPVEKITFRRGQKLNVGRFDKEGNYYMPELWEIVDVDYVSMTLVTDNGDKVRIRR